MENETKFGVKQAPTFDPDIFRVGSPVEVTDYQEGKDIFVGIITEYTPARISYRTQGGNDFWIYIECYLSGDQEVRFFKKEISVTGIPVVELIRRMDVVFDADVYDDEELNFPPIEVDQANEEKLFEWLHNFMAIQKKLANQVIEEAAAEFVGPDPDPADPEAPAEG